MSVHDAPSRVSGLEHGLHRGLEAPAAEDSAINPVSRDASSSGRRSERQRSITIKNGQNKSFVLLAGLKRTVDYLFLGHAHLIVD